MSVQGEQHLDRDTVAKYLKNTYPYSFVDEADVIPGKSANGKRYFPPDEWFFAHHFPGHPLVPGVFILEVIMQTAALAIYADGAVGCDYIFARRFKDVIFTNEVRPGECLIADTMIDRFRHGFVEASGVAVVIRDGVRVSISTSRFEMVIPGVISGLRPTRR